LWNDLKIRRIAVIYQNDAFGADILRGVTLALGRFGARPEAVGSYERMTTNVSEALAAVRKADPEAVILGSTYKPAAQVLREAKEAKWSPLFATLSVISTENFMQAAGANAEKVIISQVVPVPDRTDLAAVKAYQQAVKKYTPEVKPSFPGLQGYVNAMIMALG